MDTRLFFTLPALVLWASCRKDEPALPLPRYPICWDITIRDPAVPYELAVGHDVPETAVWIDTDGEPQWNIQLSSSKSDVNPGPGTFYEYFIQISRMVSDSIGFMTGSDVSCYDWFFPGDTLWPDAQLVGSSLLHYSSNMSDPDCAAMDGVRFVGFVRLVEGARRCGYLRIEPFEDLNPQSHYSIRVDQVRLSECDWTAVVLPIQ